MEFPLIIVALAVAVEDPRDGCVPPIHDAHAPLDAGGAPQAEITAAIVFAQAQMGEVGGAGIYLGGLAGAAQLPQ